jgi:hypothetical protein
MRGAVKALLVVVAVALAACGKDSVLGVGGSGSVAGSYTLRTINGNNLPFTVEQIGDDKTEVLSETMVLGDSTFSLSGSARVTAAGVTTTEPYANDGTFTQNGSSVILTFSSGARESGTVSSGTLTLASGGFTLVYRR